MTGLAVIFLMMTMLRIWFDLAEADIVLNDQRAVRKSMGGASATLSGACDVCSASYVRDHHRRGGHSAGRSGLWMKSVSPAEYRSAHS